MIAVTKEFTFDCAHMLEGHKGLCRNLHGHTYKLLIGITPMEGMSGLDDGMVIDFKDLKEFVKREIVDKFDHALVINEISDDPFEQALLQVATEHGRKVALVDYRPTAENMVAEFARNLRQNVFNGLRLQLTSVKLYETPTSYAEWTPGGM